MCKVGRQSISCFGDMSDLESREESLIRRNFSICEEKASHSSGVDTIFTNWKQYVAKTTSENWRIFMHSISQIRTTQEFHHLTRSCVSTEPVLTCELIVLPRSTIYIEMSGMPQILTIKNRLDRRESILNPKLRVSPQRPFYLSYTQNFLLDFNSYSINLTFRFIQMYHNTHGK